VPGVYRRILARNATLSLPDLRHGLSARGCVGERIGCLYWQKIKISADGFASEAASGCEC